MGRKALQQKHVRILKHGSCCHLGMIRATAIDCTPTLLGRRSTAKFSVAQMCQCASYPISNLDVYQEFECGVACVPLAVAEGCSR